MGVGFGGGGKVSGDGVLVDVGLTGGEVLGALDEVVGVAALPDGEFGGEAVGVAAFDEVHDLREGFVAWGEDEVGVIRHEDEGVEEVVGAIVLEGFEEEFGVAGDLEDAATIVGNGGDEESACGGGSLRDCHGVSVWVRLAAVKCVEIQPSAER